MWLVRIEPDEPDHDNRFLNVKAAITYIAKPSNIDN